VETGQAGAGMIIRRADGSVVFSACWYDHEAELMVCLEGVRIAVGMDLAHITIETDCQVLVQVAVQDDRDGSALGHLIEDVRSACFGAMWSYC
jgi:ribonuclease HI